MPRDANGVYALPTIYKATTGTTILAAQHNGPLEDIQSALTGSLPRDGSAPMTAPLKLSDGDAAAPALRFNSIAGRGLFKTADGLGIAVGGMKVAEFTSEGLIGLPLGTPILVPDGVLPALCVWADGRNISRSTYAALFTKWASKFGAGDGSTTFGVPDWRGSGFIGRDNFGGTDANRLASVPAVSGDRLTVGSVLGGNLHTLLAAELADHTHPVSVSGTYGDYYPIGSTYVVSNANPQYNLPIMTSYGDTTRSFSGAGTAAANTGGGAHNNVQRSIVCDIAIFAGA